MKVEYFDMIKQAVSILQDHRLQDGFMTKPDIVGTGSDGVYGKMNIGRWWEDTQKRNPPVFILYFL